MSLNKNQSKIVPRENRTKNYKSIAGEKKCQQMLLPCTFDIHVKQKANDMIQFVHE